MDMARIGTSDLEIFPLGLGGNTFGGRTDAAASEEVLDAFVAGGGNFIDTADSYSHWVPGNRGGESETVLGEWMRRRGNRSQVVIATKVAGHPEFKGLAPDTIARAADASLQRLQTDYIDLYYAHHDDPSTPVAEMAKAFDALVRAGKVRHVAISNLPPDRIAEWMRLARENGLALPVALQPQYSLVSRHDYEQKLAPLADVHELAVFPYFALANGFLTGKYRTPADLEGSSRGDGVAPYLNSNGLRLSDGEVALASGAVMATVALAWLLAKPTITAPLASATSPAQLAELLAVPDLRLSDGEVAALDEASRPFA
jgi:aryl-alcohol dehydrogenase-like predicted oxidoreductase